ncbi:hypothetical protein DYD21_00525 [Rhodohalobacter sp. SW132]|nr:hypothetical protein DYD21_00525 [Rhodohalobacter sp. SW132]
MNVQNPWYCKALRVAVKNNKSINFCCDYDWIDDSPQ